MTIITDKTGRKIGVQRLDPGDFLDLLEAAGPASANSGFVGYASIVSAVRDIDGVPVPFPSSKEDVKALARKVGADAIGMVATALGEADKTGDTMAVAGN